MNNALPFLHNVCIQSADFDEAKCFINSWVDERDITPLSAGGHSENLITLQPLADTMVFGAQWSERVRIRSAQLTTFHVVMVLSGCIHSRTLNLDVSAGNLLVLPPGQYADLVWEKGSNAIVITLSRQALLDYFGISSETALRTEATVIPRGQPITQLLHSSLTCLAQQHEIYQGQLLQSIQKHWESLLIAQLSDEFQRSDVGNFNILPARVRQATDWILAHITEPMTVADVLRVTGCSRRSLESGFKKYLNTTPARFIIRHKLLGVRNTLINHCNANIGDVAFEFGFSHLSHFTQQYRDAFGELPSQTLKNHQNPISVCVEQCAEK